jgi:putative hydrolase of the HAD superfamily
VIKAVLFDIGGVLVRTEDRTPRTAMARRYGMTYDELSTLVFGNEAGRQAQLGVVSGAEHWAYVCRTLGAPATAAEALRDEFFAGDALDQELLAYIRRLRPRYRTGLLSNALSDVRLATQEKWQIAADFEVQVFSAEVGLLKPDVRIFQLALEQFHLPPAEVVFVDDFTANVQGAQALGLTAVQFHNTAQVCAELDMLLA